jgi:hypothetical protein
VVSPASAAPPAITYLFPAGAQRGNTVEVTATGTFDKWPAKAWVSGKGVSVEAGKTKGTFTVTVAKDAEPGVRWLRAYNDDGGSNLRPFFVGMIPEVAEKEPNDDTKKPQVIEAPSVTVNGRLAKSGDVDCFAVKLKKGQTLVASLDANHTLRSPMDAILQVVSTDGFVLDENHDYHGLDPQLAYTAPKDGTFVVRVFAFPSQPDSSIRFFGSEACIYRLTLATEWFADHTLPLAVGTNGPERVGVEGWNTPPEGKELAVDPAAVAPGEQFLTVFGPKLVNPVRVKVEPHPAIGLGGKDVLKPPFSVTGRIEKPGGEATITFEGKKGQALSVQVESQDLGLAVNPVVRVLDAGKKQLARAEPGKLHSDTTLSFTPPADGTYTAVVSDLYKGGGPRFAFLLRVTPPEPDYDLTLTTDRFTITPGKPTAIPVKVARKNGFKGDIELAAEGLPAGVKFEITKPAKPDPNTITVSLTADAAAAGPFRLVGRVENEPRLTHPARAPLAEFETSTADLWLTVTAPAKK